MRHFIVSILVLASSLFTSVSACGPYYPGGDDIRFCILKPELFKYAEFSDFNYCSSLFYNNIERAPLQYNADSIYGSEKMNVDLWRKRCKNIPSEKDVYSAIYILGDELNDSKSTNTFIHYLYQHNDLEALYYLQFAKKCGVLNAVIEDPWERQEYAKVPQRGKLIAEAKRKLGTLDDEDLQTRYAFLIIRLAYYNNDSETIKYTYDAHFKSKKPTTIIDYWSMSFMMKVEEEKDKANYYIAQVFLNAPDKRWVSFNAYDRNISALNFRYYANDKKEESAVWLLDGLKKTGRSLGAIKKMYSLAPEEKGLSFLLLREINKLEDWIFTPYYTLFSPSIVEDYDGGEKYSAERIMQDRLYAKELLNFVNSVSLNKVENPLLWRTAKAYLLYMTEDYNATLLELAILEKEVNKETALHSTLDILKALALTARQEPGKAIILDDVKPILMNESSKFNQKFLFAMARELEYKGNTTDAAILMSRLNSEPYTGWNEEIANTVFWKTPKYHSFMFYDFFENYFFYLDAQYSPEQLKLLITDIQNNKAKDAFNTWKYKLISKDLSRLFDLLGTKYIRRNDLNNALVSFEQVNDTLWTSSQYAYAAYLDANPFYTNMFNEHRKTAADTITYTKTSITRTLIAYLKRAEDPKNKDRDYYYFLAANCYLNMTQYGNSWMMRRYWWSSSEMMTLQDDDAEYFKCLLAKKYYLKAGEVSRSDKFAALCLRMAARCEEYNLMDRSNDPYGESQTSEGIQNAYFLKLKERFPNYYDDLVSNCESFEPYFKTRN